MTAPTMSVLSGPGSTDGPALVAAAIPVAPPRPWFDRTEQPAGTPLTFTTEGRVFGRVAPRDVDHVGMPGQGVRAPYSRCNHAYFMTGQVRCKDGSTVNTGPLTMLTGHADLNSNELTAASHYDHTGTAVADLVVWDQADGVYCAGAARPGVTPEQMRMAMGSVASGDWRPINADGFRGHEMVAALLVNHGGFPGRRDQYALAASADHTLESGIVPDWDNPPVIVRASAATEESAAHDTPEETPMAEEPKTDEPTATSSGAVTAAAPPFAKGEPAPADPAVDTSAEAEQVAEGSPVGVPDGQTGVVTEVDENQVASVLVQVPLSDLKLADEQAVMASAAGIREIVKDARLKSELKEMRAEFSEQIGTLTAALESSEKRANAAEVAGDLDHILASAEPKS